MKNEGNGNALCKLIEEETISETFVSQCFRYVMDLIPKLQETIKRRGRPKNILIKHLKLIKNVNLRNQKTNPILIQIIILNTNQKQIRRRNILRKMKNQMKKVILKQTLICQVKMKKKRITGKSPGRRIWK